MPDRDQFGDAAIEAILRGRRPSDEGWLAVSEFADDVRSFVDGPVPKANASLATVLSTGFSTEKATVLVTAGSNVNGPAEQVAGLPKWRKRHSMLPTGFLSSLATKIVAGVLTGFAGVTAIGAAGALPGPAQNAVANVVNTVTPLNLPTGGGDAAVSVAAKVNPAPTPGANSGVTAAVEVPAAGAAAGATTNAGTTGSSKAGGASTGGNAGASASVTTPTIPGVGGLPGLGGALPGLGSLPNVGSLPIPQCIKDIVNVNSGLPKVPLSTVSPQVVNCVKSLISTSGAPIPAGISTCVNSILNMLAGITPGTVPNIQSLNINSCVPVDVTACMSSVMGMINNFLPGFGLGFGGSTSGSTGTGGTSGTGSFLGGMGFNIPFMGSINLNGCMPFNLDTCLNSLLHMAGNLPGLATGGIPGLGAGSLPSLGSLNLAACVPFGSLTSIPGLGNLSSFLPL